MRGVAGGGLVGLGAPKVQRGAYFRVCQTFPLFAFARPFVGNVVGRQQKGARE